MSTLLQTRIEALARLLKQGGPADFPARRMVLFPDGGIPSEQAAASLWISGGRLHALAVMEDSDVFNTAEGLRARTWETGDVMELFIQPDEQEKNYFEYHVTPSGAALSLRIPDAEKLVADVYALEDLMFDSAFEYQNGILDGFGWWAHAAVPLEELTLSDSSRARGCVCRYNYNAAWKEPECSSTALLTGCASFHTPERWHWIKSD